ncbi:hypothetical protein IWX81_002485 [Salinibacterium sp. CAN_S4]|uniref:family 43 glycosylhydrolase n=1 Tax=Salinibacterium sp. CAN_S4 TaxID=2787727 RepID=UPI0018EF5A03
MRFRKLFALLVSAALVAIALVASGAPAAAAPRTSIPNDTWWYDAGGKIMSSQGGSVLKVGNTYYWVGIEFATTGQYPFGAVNMYQSTDLVNWTFVKAIVTPQTSGDLASGRWVGRPDLVYNPTTSTYVLIMEIDGSGSGVGPGNKIGFATSSTVTGTYTYRGSTAVNGSTMGDHSVFVDGPNAYLAYSGDTPGDVGLGGRNVTINIAQLANDWLSVRPAMFSEANGGHEAPFILKIGSKFHWFTSGTNWWASTATQHRVSTTLTAWPAWNAVATTPASPDSFNTQFDFIIPITGTSGTSYIAAGDRYTNFQGQGYPAPTGIGRNAWMPLTFAGDTPTLHGYSDLTINLASGSLGGNAIANARFENEGGTQTPASWSEFGDRAPTYTRTGGVTGNRLTFSSTAKYDSYVYQTITGLRNGTYTLSVQMTGSGTHEWAALIGKPSGSLEAQANLNFVASQWTTRTVTFTVTNGSAEIGVYVKGTPNSWIKLDNFSLTRNP